MFLFFLGLNFRNGLFFITLIFFHFLCTSLEGQLKTTQCLPDHLWPPIEPWCCPWGPAESSCLCRELLMRHPPCTRQTRLRPQVGWQWVWELEQSLPLDISNLVTACSAGACPYFSMSSGPLSWKQQQKRLLVTGFIRRDKKKITSFKQCAVFLTFTSFWLYLKSTLILLSFD